jgi:hypothetical protein
MKKWKFAFGKPTRFELGFVILAFLFFIWMDASQNIGQGSAEPFKTMTWWGLSAIFSFGLFFALYNVMLFVVFGRALRSRKTSYKYDVIAGITGFVGLLFILGAGIFAFYGDADTLIPYLLNLPQITAYHFGIACELLALLYFIITE